jgi:hypothetical protein
MGFESRVTREIDPAGPVRPNAVARFVLIDQPV